MLSNPDPRLRELERAARAGGPGEEARYLVELRRSGQASHQQLMRLRQLEGEVVDPWEFHSERAFEIGHTFLKACESWGWEGTKARGTPGRVEGKRLCFEPGSRKFRGIYMPVTLEYEPAGGPRSDAILLAFSAREAHEGEWRPGTRPQEAFGMLVPPDLRACQGAPLERFYVVPSSYPMYRNPEESQTGITSGVGPEAEIGMHLQAVEWFVAHGAIRYALPEDPGITRLRETRQPYKGLRTPEQIEDYLRWWDAYRQRVLVQVVNKQGARRFPGGWTTDCYGWDFRSDHNSRILFPFMWARARLMKRVGKKWKNNPLRVPLPKGLRPATTLVLPNPTGCTLISLDEDSNFEDIEAVTDRDPYQILDDAQWLFGLSGIHPDSNEIQHHACIDSEGKVLGVSAVGYFGAADEADPLQRPRYSFSVAVAEDARRRGIANALVAALVQEFPKDEVLLEGKVVNPHMAALLDRHGFVYEQEYDEGPWSDTHLRLGRRMYRPNPDPRIRGLERAAWEGDRLAAAQWVRQRQRAGERVAPAELIELGLATGMEKLPYDKRGNHVIRTGHKAFDRQTRAIMPGQLVGPTQHSNVIRAHSYDQPAYEKESWGPGYFQNFDLNHFPGLDPFIASFVVNNAKDQNVILYQFFVRRPRGAGIRDLGYVVTRENGQLLGRFARGHPKARSVIEAVTPVVSWQLLPEFADLIPTGVRGSTPRHRELWNTLLWNPS